MISDLITLMRSWWLYGLQPPTPRLVLCGARFRYKAPTKQSEIDIQSLEIDPMVHIVQAVFFGKLTTCNPVIGRDNQNVDIVIMPTHHINQSR
ncbi:hypothetical protein [Aeromonas caviae]|uniref:hypothetical protein n=1 Tax=Aeromonas caviae TaxID=648 RepID=UPI001CC561B9|nr:hypothetical protein [Aeromonas caviae]